MARSALAPTGRGVPSLLSPLLLPLLVLLTTAALLSAAWPARAEDCHNLISGQAFSRTAYSGGFSGSFTGKVVVAITGGWKLTVTFDRELTGFSHGDSQGSGSGTTWTLKSAGSWQNEYSVGQNFRIDVQGTMDGSEAPQIESWSLTCSGCNVPCPSGDVPTPTPMPPAPTATPTCDSDLAKQGTKRPWELISKDEFYRIFTHLREDPSQCDEAGATGCGVFTYESFIDATSMFPCFLQEGSDDTRLDELAAFFGQTGHETSGGGWACVGPDCYQWSYYYAAEVICYGKDNPLCAYTSPTYASAPKQQYFGRGAIQLSWNYNYGRFSEAVFNGNKSVLIEDAARVLREHRLALSSAIWFWMMPDPSTHKPSAHDVVVRGADGGSCRPTGYGLITNVINGGLECGQGQKPQQDDRIRLYKQFADVLGVPQSAMMDNLDCNSQTSYPESCSASADGSRAELLFTIEVADSAGGGDCRAVRTMFWGVLLTELGIAPRALHVVCAGDGAVNARSTTFQLDSVWSVPAKDVGVDVERLTRALDASSASSVAQALADALGTNVSSLQMRQVGDVEVRDNSGGGGGGLSAGAIAGIVLGAVAGAALIAVLGVMAYKRAHRGGGGASATVQRENSGSFTRTL